MHLDLQPTLENELVLLRPLHEDDREPLYQVAKDPLIWEQHPCHDRYQKEAYQTFFNDTLASQGTLVVIDRAKNSMIGSSRFNKIGEVDNAIEIGWSFLAREYWGGRYNKAVKRLMIDHALATVDYVIFYIDKNNVRSQKAVEKIGARRLTDTTLNYLIRQNDVDFTYCFSNGGVEE